MRTDSTKSNRTTIRATRALKFRRAARCNSRESGVTMALVAIAMACARYGEANVDRLVELDINPVIVRPQGRGAVAVDALIRLLP